MPAAVFADDVGDLVGNLQTGGAHLLFRVLQVLFKLSVKFPQGLHPVGCAFLYPVQIGFHLGGEVDVDDAAELILHQVVGHLAQLGGNQALAVALDITALDDGG